MTTGSEDSVRSSDREKLVEHLFLANILQEMWTKNIPIEVSRSEVDCGYDLILEAKGIIRHIQLKSTLKDGKARKQNIRVSLADKPSGCVVWMFLCPDNNNGRFDCEYYFFGSGPGEKMPRIHDFKIARHGKGDSTGFKKDRPALREIPRSKFQRFQDISELTKKLFGI